MRRYGRIKDVTLRQCALLWQPRQLHDSAAVRTFLGTRLDWLPVDPVKGRAQQRGDERFANSRVCSCHKKRSTHDVCIVYRLNGCFASGFIGVQRDTRMPLRWNAVITKCKANRASRWERLLQPPLYNALGKMHAGKHFRNMRIVVAMSVPGPARADLQPLPLFVHLLEARAVYSPHVAILGRQ